MQTYPFDTTHPVSADQLGGKGKALLDMTKWGLPVPMGFVIPTDFWHQYMRDGYISEENKKIIFDSLTDLGKKVGLIFGDPINPLTVSARSAAKFSMPAMMDTILNIGLNDQTLAGVESQIGKHGAYSAYPQFLRMFGHSVLRIPSTVFDKIEYRLEKKYKDFEYLEQLTKAFKEEINKSHKFDFNNLDDVLIKSIEAVFRSFNNPGAIEYRNVAGIDPNIGTAVVVQLMVYGCISAKSGSAVLFTRDPETGEQKLNGHFLSDAQGESVVRGISHPLPVAQLPSGLYAFLQEKANFIESKIQNDADIEVTWQEIEPNATKQEVEKSNGVYVLQSRVHRLPPKVYFKVQKGLVEDHIKTENEVVENELTTGIIYGASAKEAILSNDNHVLCKGSKLHTGIGIGKVTFDVEEAKKRINNGEKVVLICSHFDPNDLELLTTNRKLITLVTTEGGPSSHMGIVVGVLRIPTVMGILDAEIDHEKDTMTVKSAGKEITIKANDTVSVDSFTGLIYAGVVEIAKSEQDEFTKKIISEWESKFGKGNIWADFANRETLDALEVEFAKVLFDSSKYKSKKAGQTHIINEFFNPEISICTDIIDSENIDEIVNAIEKVKNAGKGIWMRSCYSPDLLEAPYASVDFSKLSIEEIKDWLINPKNEAGYSRYGNYQAWKKIENDRGSYDLAYALIPHDPDGKLDKSVFADHFVCSLRCENGEASKIVVEISDGSPHMRTLGTKKQPDLMHLNIVSNSALPSKIGRYYYSFGHNLFNQDILENYETQSNLIEKLSEIGIKPKNAEEFVAGFNKLIENGQITDDELGIFMNPRVLSVIKYTAKTIIKDWWKKYDVASRMSVLNKVTGASVLEIQGRLSDNSKWMRIYGAKGQEENEIYGKLGAGE